MSWTDQTTTAEKIAAIKTQMAAIEDLLSGRITADVNSYSIRGRQISKMTPGELIQTHKWLQSKLNQLEAQQSVDDGDGNPNKILVRFV